MSELTERMRAAAETLSEVASVFHPNDSYRWCRSEYSGVMLRSIADRWDRESAEKAAADEAVEELAREMHLARIVSTAFVGSNKDWDDANDLYRKVVRTEARQLWISGYRKGGAS